MCLHGHSSSRVAGHKHECKKLRLAAKRAAAAAAAAARGAGTADDAAVEDICGSNDTTLLGDAGDTFPAAASQQEQTVVSNSELPLPKALLMSNDEYRALVEEAPSRAGPCGLSNCGNTCFANSLLQCLLATPALAAVLLTQRHSKGGCTAKGGWCLVCELERLAAAAYTAKPGGVVSPKPLLQHVRKIARQMTFGRQEDAHELFVQLLDGIERAELEAADGPCRFTVHDRATGVVGRTWATWLRASVECGVHGHASSTYDPQVALPLDVSAATPTVEDALRAFTGALTCTACRTRSPADAMAVATCPRRAPAPSQRPSA